jgi:hypothetical protein
MKDAIAAGALAVLKVIDIGQPIAELRGQRQVR